MIKEILVISFMSLALLAYVISIIFKACRNRKVAGLIEIAAYALLLVFSAIWVSLYGIMSVLGVARLLLLIFSIIALITKIMFYAKYKE